MRVEETHRNPMNELNDVSVTDSIDRLRHNQIGIIRPLDNPPIVDVLVGIAGYLLLMR